MEVMQGQYKDTKIGRIPKDWELLPVGKCILKKKFTVGKLSKKDYFKTGSFPIIDQSKTFVIGYTNQSELLYSGNLPAIIYGDHTNHVKYVDFPFVCGADGVKIIQPLTELDNKFIYYSIFYRKPQSEGYKRHFSILKEKDLCIPPLPEQQKIAEILSTLDEQISTTQAIVDKSKELKKGLMQKLFSEGIGHTEFKDTKIGRIPKDWEVVKITDIGTVIDSLHQTPKFSDVGYPMVRVGDINKSKLTLDSCLTVPKDVFEAFTKKHLPRKGDILITRVGSFGKTILVEDDSPFCLGQNTAVITGVSNEKYAYYMLNSHPIIKQIGVLTNGSTQPSLSLKEIRNIKISVGSKEEQQKIVDILSEADAKIEKEEQEKAKLEELKKGLMQQLLTGKKRVKV